MIPIGQGLYTMMLEMPTSFKGRIVQYAGRILRENPGKENVVIYDYVDVNLGLTISMFRKRLAAYRKLGYTIEATEGSKAAELVGGRTLKKRS